MDLGPLEERVLERASSGVSPLRAPGPEVALAVLVLLALGAAGASALRPVHGALEALVHLLSLR